MWLLEDYGPGLGAVSIKRTSDVISGDLLESVLAQPNGATFYRCALQVNPFSYLVNHKKASTFSNEASYNAAIMDACVENGIRVIAVTDHHKIMSSVGLLEAAKAAGLFVFPGFEATTKDGVHLLCLFDPDRDLVEIDRIIGSCGVIAHGSELQTGRYDVTELLQEARTWRAICIAAHVAADKGLLTTLQGQARVQAWTSPELLACALPGPVDKAPENLRPILLNKAAEFRRKRPVAIINASDVSNPEMLAAPSASTFIKMSEVSIEGLRQAFLDPGSRIRLLDDPVPERHSELVGITWEGGFLDGASIHFNQNLNILIGGRGTGKSTIIESVRYALGLEPLGEEARRAHEGIIRQVLKSGTKTTLWVRSTRPDPRIYRIERTVPNPPIVRNEAGQTLNMLPTDVAPRTEVYGQHEISELARKSEQVTKLLERFTEEDSISTRRKTELQRALERSRAKILELKYQQSVLAERLGALPALEETLRRYREAGLEDRLKEQSLLVREERILQAVQERLDPLRTILDELDRELPIDCTFLSAKALEDLPGRAILAEAEPVLTELTRELQRVVIHGQEAIARAEQGLMPLKERWNARRDEVQAAYERILRDLQRSKVDGEEFIRLRQRIEDLRPLGEQTAALSRDLLDLDQQRQNLLAEWADVKAAEFRALDRAARRVSRMLSPRVRVEVKFQGNREPLLSLIKEHVKGRLSETEAVLRQRQDLSTMALAEAIRLGRDALIQLLSIPSTQAERLGQAGLPLAMLVEEVDLSATTRVELNVANEGDPPVWKGLGDLSTGQRATALLLLLLLESEGPLLVDQPEDDLDNRFITESVVPKMRKEKQRRQFIFSTHNANLPVLGDADLILGLEVSPQDGPGHAEISSEHRGAIDSRVVRELVEDILEGGRDAFELRRIKYGF